MNNVRQMPTGNEVCTSTPAWRSFYTQSLSRKLLLPTASANMEQSTPLVLAARISFKISSMRPLGSIM